MSLILSISDMLSLERSRAHSLVHRIMSKQAAVRLNQQGIDLPPCQYITLIISVTKQPDWNHDINKFSVNHSIFDSCWQLVIFNIQSSLWFSLKLKRTSNKRFECMRRKGRHERLRLKPICNGTKTNNTTHEERVKKRSKQNKINLRVQMNLRYRFLALTICPLQVRTQNIFVLLLSNDHTHSIHSHDFSLFDLDTLYKLLCSVWNGHLTKTMINKLLTNKKANNYMQINKSRNCVECKRLWSHSFTPS